MRILLFGGTGFLGSAIAPRLRDAGHAVTVLTRDPADRGRVEAMGARALVGDLLAPSTFAAALCDIDAMVLVAAPRVFGRRLGRANAQRLLHEITAIHSNAVGLARSQSCPIVITGGTSFRTAAGQVADETWPLQRIGIARIGAGIDPIVERAVADGAPKVIWMLPGQIYGPGGLFLEMVKMAQRGRAVVLGDGQNHIPRIHVDDCATAYVAGIERLDRLPTGSRFILTDDVACTADELMRHLCELLAVHGPRHVPPLIARALLGGLLYETASMDCTVSNARAKQVFGWKPRYPSYRQGLPATLVALGLP